jgi:hypothetical protein
MISPAAEDAYREAWRDSIPAEFAAPEVRPPKPPKPPRRDRFDQFLREMVAHCGSGASMALTAPELLTRPGMRAVFEEHGKWSVSTVGHWFSAHKSKPYGPYMLCRTFRAERIVWYVDVLPSDC